jgi:hypothetical protein
MSLTLKQKLISLQYQSGFSFKGIMETFDNISEDYDSGKVTNQDFQELFSDMFFKKQIEITLDEFQRVCVAKYGMFESKINISSESMLVNKLVVEFSKKEISLYLIKEEIYKNIPNEWKQHLEYVSHEVQDTLDTDMLSMLSLLIKNKAHEAG